MLSFYCAARIEQVHPMDGGAFRLKFRRDRRSGLPLENPFLFYTRYLKEIVVKHMKFFMNYLVFLRRYKRVMNEREPSEDHDIAMQPVDWDELDKLELYTNSESSILVVEKIKKKAMKNPKVAAS